MKAGCIVNRWERQVGRGTFGRQYETVKTTSVARFRTEILTIEWHELAGKEMTISHTPSFGSDLRETVILLKIRSDSEVCKAL